VRLISILSLLAKMSTCCHKNIISTWNHFKKISRKVLNGHLFLRQEVFNIKILHDDVLMPGEELLVFHD